MPRKKQPNVAFVLSGGASLGAIQVGMLRALYERDIRPDSWADLRGGRIAVSALGSGLTLRRFLQV